MSLYIDTQEAFDEFLVNRGKAGIEEIGLDLEADSLHNYGETLCLIQYADKELTAIIDPLAVPDISALKAFVDQRDLWMHGSDYDMTLFRKNMDWMPMHTKDTQIAARLVGFEKFGLANLLNDCLGIEVSKDNQKDDWSLRPLPQPMIDYAISDVLYLSQLSSFLVAKLQELDRYEWFLESCVWQQEKIADRSIENKDSWRIPGSGKFNRKGLNYLKFLWEWRDTMACQRNRPSFKIANNKQIVNWVNKLVEGEEIILPRNFSKNKRDSFFKAIKEARSLDAKLHPELVKKIRVRKPQGADAVLDEILKSRNSVAEKLKLDPTTLGSKSAYEAVAYGAPIEENFMRWQIDLLDFNPLFQFRHR